MCRICDGFTIEEVIAEDAAEIAEQGFVLQGVAGGSGRGDDPDSWVYTVGLLDTIGHPEMIIAGAGVDTGGRVLNHLARWAIEDDERFEPGDAIELGTAIADVGKVHDAHFGRNRGTFNMWYTLKAARIVRSRRLRAVQILLPDELSPFGDRSWQPDLSNPAARV